MSSALRSTHGCKAELGVVPQKVFDCCLTHGHEKTAFVACSLSGLGKEGGFRGPGWNRTNHLRGFNPVFYQLNYKTIWMDSGIESATFVVGRFPPTLGLEPRPFSVELI